MLRGADPAWVLGDAPPVLPVPAGAGSSVVNEVNVRLAQVAER